MRLVLLLFVLSVAGCAKTSERAEGTENPDVTVPVEIPVGSDPYTEADSAAADTALE